MKTLSIKKMENVEGGGWLEAVGCGAGIGLVVASAGVNIFAFAEGVLVIYTYCGEI